VLHHSLGGPLAQRQEIGAADRALPQFVLVDHQSLDVNDEEQGSREGCWRIGQHEVRETGGERNPKGSEEAGIWKREAEVEAAAETAAEPPPSEECSIAARGRSTGGC
jgi:hypothetical protein